MNLADILARVDMRRKALGLSDNAAQNRAGKPGAISNLRPAVKQGKKRSGISTATLRALAPVLEVRPEWLLTGKEEMDGADSGRHAERTDAMSESDVMQLLTWCFELLDGATEEEARVAARALLRAYRTPQAPDGSVSDSQGKRQSVKFAIDLFRPPKR
jgi:hypothetical protein